MYCSLIHDSEIRGCLNKINAYGLQSSFSRSRPLVIVVVARKRGALGAMMDRRWPGHHRAAALHAHPPPLTTLARVKPSVRPLIVLKLQKLCTASLIRDGRPLARTFTSCAMLVPHAPLPPAVSVPFWGLCRASKEAK